MTHLAFVVASYAAAALGLGGILIWLRLDGRRQRMHLHRLQKQNSSRQTKTK